jgi:hypothetical protein
MIYKEPSVKRLSLTMCLLISLRIKAMSEAINPYESPRGMEPEQEAPIQAELVSQRTLGVRQLDFALPLVSHIFPGTHRHDDVIHINLWSRRPDGNRIEQAKSIGPAPTVEGNEVSHAAIDVDSDVLKPPPILPDDRKKLIALREAFKEPLEVIGGLVDASKLCWQTPTNDPYALKHRLKNIRLGIEELINVTNGELRVNTADVIINFTSQLSGSNPLLTYYCKERGQGHLLDDPQQKRAIEEASNTLLALFLENKEVIDRVAHNSFYQYAEHGLRVQESVAASQGKKPAGFSKWIASVGNMFRPKAASHVEDLTKGDGREKN